MKFCKECGCVIDGWGLCRKCSISTRKQNIEIILRSRYILLMLAWVFLLPLMGIIAIAKSEKLSIILKGIFILLIVLLCSVVITFNLK